MHNDTDQSNYTWSGHMQHETSPQYLRASDIIRNRKTGQPGILPISNATLWAWVKAGKLQPIKLSAGITVFRKSDVIALAESPAGVAQ
jgi:predicted DNA-binding transcriptional regulator AlpA